MTPRQRATLALAKRSRAWCIDCDWAKAPATTGDSVGHVVANPRHIVVHDRLVGVAAHTSIVRRSADV